MKRLYYILTNEKGNVSLLILFIIIVPVIMMMYALNTDVELAHQYFFRAKGSLNRAVHASSLQIDDVALSKGIYKIDETKAQEEFYKYLKYNLQLDDNLTPLPNTFLEDQVTVLEYKVVNTGPFPYHYVNSTYDLDVWLSRPGVIAVVEVKYPRTFNILGPITWQVKASHELTYR